MQRSRKFYQRGSNYDVFWNFLFDEGREHPNTVTLKAGQQWPASITLFRWRANDGPSLNAGLVALYFFKGIQTIIA